MHQILQNGSWHFSFVYEFESRSGDCYNVFFSRYRQILEQYLKIFHGRFLPVPTNLSFMNVRRYIIRVVLKSSLKKTTNQYFIGFGTIIGNRTGRLGKRAAPYFFNLLLVCTSVLFATSQTDNYLFIFTQIG
jgi:hypothetical protein